MVLPPRRPSGKARGLFVGVRALANAVFGTSSWCAPGPVPGPCYRPCSQQCSNVPGLCPVSNPATRPPPGRPPRPRRSSRSAEARRWRLRRGWGQILDAFSARGIHTPPTHSAAETPVVSLWTRSIPMETMAVPACHLDGVGPGGPSSTVVHTPFWEI